MNLAIMQPYFLPYIGYFQLIAAVDRIVMLDDVSYINRGWINRNRFPVNGKPVWFTVPLVGASQNKLIKEIDILPDDGWKRNMTLAISTAYRSAPQYTSVMPILEFLLASATGNLSTFLYHSLRTVCDHIGIRTQIVPTSSVYPKGELKGQQRILDICRREQATTYVNLPGGRELYEVSRFYENGISLIFLNSAFSTLKVSHSSVEGPVLSILDLLMLNEPEVVLEAAMSPRPTQYP
jgi:hypothetical protein